MRRSLVGNYLPTYSLVALQYKTSTAG